MKKLYPLLVSLLFFAFWGNANAQSNCINFIFSPADYSIECGEFPAFQTPIAMDVCCSNEDIAFTYEDSDYWSDCTHIYTRTWTGTSSCGNTATHTQSINQIDEAPPVLTINHSQLMNRNSGDTIWLTCDSIFNMTQNSVLANDDCSGPIELDIFDELLLGNCPTDGYFELLVCTWTAKDDCDNSSSFTINVAYIDSIPPVITCPPDAIGECGIPGDWGTATGVDNCDDNVYVLYFDDTTFVNSCQFIIDREWHGKDNCLNIDICHQTITIEDTTPPDVSCPSDVTLECDAIADPSITGFAWGTDLCDPNPAISWSDDTLYVNNLCDYLIIRTWRATDGCDLYTECEQVINFEDTTPPTIYCPSEYTAECDQDAPPSVAGYATATDNCDNDLTITYSDVVSVIVPNCYRIITRTWRATDDCGNYKECDQSIKFLDSTDPIITCPADATVECNTPNDPSVTGYPTATDNCDNDLDFIYSDNVVVIDDCETQIHRTWTATDNCGNYNECTQIITIRDFTNPVITCPNDATIECNTSIDPSVTGYAIATDNCDLYIDISYSDDVVVVDDCTTLIHRTWTATDNCGNSDACTQVITIQDFTNPVITCPENATVECNTPNDPSITGYATATDNCDDDIDIIYNDDVEVVDDCTTLIHRTWTATDNCGNTDVCTQVITIQDFTNPVITCPADATVECNTPNDPSVTGYATATDNCDDDIDIYYEDVTIEINACETHIHRKWTATDNCGNYDECTQIITIRDFTNPVITCPADATVECNTSVQPDVTGYATATDNCDDDITIIFVDNVNVVDSCTTIITRTWSALDNCGNMSDCSQIITIKDFTNPVITCPADATVECNTPNDPSVTEYATATDNCDDDITITYEDDVQVIDACETQIHRTWTATDNCGNSDQCTQVITIQDFTNPVITCPSDATVECNTPNDPSVTGYATATDNCDDDIEISYTDDVEVVDDCTTLIHRTWTATDNCGNSDACMQVITIQDFTNPVITCPADATVECNTPNDPSVTGYATATDNCDHDIEITYTDNVEVVDNCTTLIHRTWTATDNCGNNDACTQVITIQDFTNPVITCPADATVECNTPNDPSVTGYATATDNCDDDIEITYTDNVEVVDNCTTLIHRTWTATDNCGNSDACTQFITIQDFTNPVITCPADATVECNTPNDPSVTGYATATDNCDDDIEITYTDNVEVVDNCTTLIHRTWAATDNCGNYDACTQVITIQDFTNPVITCPADATVECNTPNDPSVTGYATATDNCDDDITITYEDDVQVIDACETQIHRTWTATDNCGNYDHCTQVITIRDFTNPVITCPADAIVECNTPNDPSVTGYATATDNCDDDVDISYTDDVNVVDDCTTIITRHWSATDNCGNYDGCYQTITIQDFTNPVITCPADATVECNTPNDPSVTGYATATDNCDDDVDISYTDDVNVVDDCTTIITRHWSATDNCGNYDGCYQTITIQDFTNPVITCPADATVECNTPNDPSVTGYATATDNCDDDVDISYIDDVNVVDDCTTIITRHWSATDNCGNYDGCYQTITIQDFTNPVITCPADATVECNTPNDPSITGYATTTDNCDDDIEITYTDNVEVVDDCTTLIHRTWTATDNCGNSDACTQVITIQDFTNPVITCPADATVECNTPNDPSVTGYATATDNCDDDVDISYTDNVNVVDDCTTIITRHWSATDNCGNYDGCYQTITIQDFTNPVITCPADATVECNTPNDPSVTGYATEIDNCDDDIDITYYDDVNVVDGCTTIITRHWSATDNCGNYDGCYQTITIQDFTNPVITCPADATVECNTPNDPSITGYATATDNCDDDVDISYTDEVNVVDDCTTIITRHWSATDNCGNYDGCYQTITIQDFTNPVITCPADATVECNTPNDPSITGYATATDNCDDDVDITYTNEVNIVDDCTTIITRHWSATDNCGNYDGCYQTITIQDFTNPVINCPADATVECNTPNDPSVTGYATATDNCDDDIDITYYDDVNVVDGCTTIITRHWSATDNCGNYDGCYQTITIQDFTNPVITCPADATVECNTPNDPSVTGYATATDNCDNDIDISYTDDVNVVDDCTTIITRHWSATDNCGNYDGCYQTITIQDFTNPVITCPADATVECNTPNDPTITGYATATDNCDDDIDITYYDDVDVVDDCTTIITRHWSATDNCGNYDGCYQTITIQDFTNPVITCPADATVECNTPNDPSVTGYATATDNCDDDVDISYTDEVNVVDDCTTIITRHWSATDNCGNYDGCYQTITIQDSTNPVITCPADATVECNTPNDPSVTGYATATDNCDDDVDISYTDEVNVVDDCTTIITRHWSATDNCGNYDGCYQTITIQDFTNPVITCPADATVECNTPNDPSITGYATATDNCDDDVDISYTDEVNVVDDCTTIITRHWSATDNCGNYDGCYQTITIQDFTNPVITCPADATVECNTPNDPTITGYATATDNCDDDIDITYYDDVDVVDDCTTIITRHWSATDNCGNYDGCYQTITIQDSTNPVITCPADATVECNTPNDPSVTGYATATDNCDDDVDISYTDEVNVVDDCTTIITRHWSATDNCGNYDGCYQTITNQDFTNPVITCPADATVECNTPNDPSVTGYATATDNCDDDVDITYTDEVNVVDDCTTIITRHWTATDNCGNYDGCYQTITIQDFTNPVITCPADATVECNTIYSPSITGYATATDNCDDDIDITFYDVADIIDSCTTIITRHWTATDNCGNEDNCYQTITISDFTNPVITCPADATVECNTPNGPSVTGYATAIDNCDDDVEIYYEDVIVVIDDCETHLHRKWTATDNCGNYDHCTQIITIRDFTNPVITCPADATVECNTSYDPSITGYVTTTDNCDDNVDITYYDDVDVVDDCTTIVTRHWTATDNCGNYDGCYQTITITDSTNPVITCPADATVECNTPNDPTITGYATATDNCDDDIDIIYYDDVDVVDDCTTIITRHWSATDNCGNYDGCYQTITIQDFTNPMITCPADATVECNTPNGPSVTGYATATDNCDDNLDITYSDYTNEVDSCTTIITRTWTATDNCGNYETCDQTITISDFTNPVITCPADVTIECNTAFDVSVTGYATATDNCDDDIDIYYEDVQVVLDDCIIHIHRKWTATDNCGNYAHCTQVIEIQDFTNPVITCPADATIECNTSSDPSITGYATATDNCDQDVEITYSDDVNVVDDCTTIITRHWSAHDECGNYDGCYQTITITDSTNPLITCPTDTTIECDESSDPAYTGYASATDNCDQDVEITYSEDVNVVDDCTTIITRHWSAHDECGNYDGCYQTITITDSTNPVITCPADTTIECDESSDPAYTGYASATDNCDDDVDISYTDNVNVVDDCTTIITRHWSATDNCGNYDGCYQTITIQDFTNPVITCPADATVECNTPNDPSVTGYATATDNCDVDIDISYTDEVNVVDDCTTIITRHWSATDNCGNYDGCYQTITIQDFTNPVITCPADATVECNTPNDPSVTGYATATDNCDDDVNISYTDEVNVVDDCTTIITRHWSATDNCGNYDGCYQTITIQDFTNPVITCPADATVECNTPNDPSVTGYATATDNCDDDVDISYTDDVNVVDGCTTIITRHWSATDNCGNYDGCYQTITIQDFTNPVITCPADATVECNTPDDPSVTGYATATDNCDDDIDITYTDDVNVVDGCTTIITRHWSATDNCGNYDGCYQTITIQDFTNPVITCPADATVECNTPNDPSVTGYASATDNCDDDIDISYTDDVNVVNGCTTIITRHWSATDNCGNYDGCYQTITIQDFTNPVITCPADATVECNTPNDPSVTGYATATDNCDDDIDISYTDEVNVVDGCTTIITRHWSAIDNCGNYDGCYQTITIQDFTNPVITCPADATVECNTPNDPSVTGYATATDNCDDDIDISYTDEVNVVDGCTTIITRHWSATDNCGNYDGCYQTITIQDFTNPVITCPADATVECNTPNDPSVTGYATATDNCDDDIDIYYEDVIVVIDDCETHIHRKWTATDNCGNYDHCTQIITIQDFTNPVITCPDDTTIECDESADPAYTGYASATDNCDEDLDISYTDDVNVIDDCTTIITRHWSAYDECGNYNGCYQTITIEDFTNPVITCPADVTIECDESSDPVYNGYATATDNCDTDIAITYVDDVEVVDECTTIIHRYWKATDNCGNYDSCTQDITIQDFTNPVITCPADVTLECDIVADPSLTGYATATDNCDDNLDITYSDDTTYVTAFCLYQIDRTWRAEDNCGNYDECIQTIYFHDTTKPSIEPNHPMIHGVANGDTIVIDCSQFAILGENDVIVTDNCDADVDVEFTESAAAGDCSLDGWKLTMDCSWISTDDCGNVEIYHITVRITDNEAPVLLGVPDDISVVCADIPAVAQVTVTDNCDFNAVLTFNEYQVSTGQYTCDLVREWSATDDCGNTATEKQIISILDCTSCFGQQNFGFINFEANVHNGFQSKLDWEFTSVPFTHAFVVERSFDNINFEPIATVEGLINFLIDDTDKYSYIDTEPHIGNNFYRIKAVNVLDVPLYSDSQLVVFHEEDQVQVYVYPNPAVDYVNVEFVGNYQNDIEIEVANQLGQIMDIIIVPATTPLQQINVSQYASGMYYVNLKINDKRPKTYKIVKR